MEDNTSNSSQIPKNSGLVSEIKRSSFGIENLKHPTPAKLKMIAEGFGAFCTVFGTSVAASGHATVGLIISGAGLFCDKFLIKCFADPNITCVTTKENK